MPGQDREENITMQSIQESPVGSFKSAPARVPHGSGKPGSSVQRLFWWPTTVHTNVHVPAVYKMAFSLRRLKSFNKNVLGLTTNMVAIQSWRTIIPSLGNLATGAERTRRASVEWKVFELGLEDWGRVLESDVTNREHGNSKIRRKECLGR